MKKIVYLIVTLLCISSFATPPILTVADGERCLVSDKTGRQTLKIKVESDVYDFTVRAKIAPYGKPAPRWWSQFVQATPETILEVDVKEVGYYELTVYAFRGKEIIAKKVTNYSVIPEPMRERPKEFGCCVHFGQGQEKGAFPLSFDLMKMAGFTRMRDDLYWSSFESKPGVYKLPERLERAVDMGREYGINTMIVIGYNNTVAYPGKFGFPFPPNQEMYNLYGKAVVEGIKQFGERVTEWELWNEPNPKVHPVNDYLEMLKVVYPMAKAANPNNTIISCGGGGAGGGPGGGMILPIIKAGGIDYQDAFSIHPYQAPYAPETGYAAKNSPIPRVNIPLVANHMRNICNRNLRSDGSKMKVYVTEIGWFIEHPTLRKYPVSPILQAAKATRMFLAMRRENTYEGIYWYDFQDDGEDEFEKEHNFGLIRKDFSPKPSYHAVAVLNGLLGNLPFNQALVDGNNRVYVYGQGMDFIIAAWTLEDTPQKIQLDLPFDVNRAKLIDWDGREKEFKIINNNKIEITLSYMPQYITVK